MKKEIARYFVDQISNNYFCEIGNEADDIYDESLLKEELRSVLRIEMVKKNRTKDDTFLIGNCKDGYSEKKYKIIRNKFERADKYLEKVGENK